MRTPLMKEKPERTETYIPGLGLVQQAGGSADDIRRMSNLLSLLLLCYPLLVRLFRMPLTYLAYLLGFSVRINPLTGLVIQTASVRTAVSALTEVVSLGILMLLVLGLYYRPISQGRIFRRPQKGVLPLAFPMLLASGAMAVICAFLLSRMMGSVGLVVYLNQEPIYGFSPEVAASLAAGLLLALFQELLFRGVILTALRQFGDTFAVLISAVLFAVWCSGVVEAVYGFLFGVCAAYFVIRSGSVYTAMLGRAGLLILLELFRLIRGLLNPREAQLALIGGGLLLALLALAAYLRFIRLDPCAFRLAPAEGALSTRARLGAFCGSVCFLLFLLGLLYRTVATVQVIG